MNTYEPTTGDLADLDYDPIRQIIQEEIRSYIVTSLAIADTGSPGSQERQRGYSEAIYQVRHLHLAEPWLPAGLAADRIRAAGLVETPNE